MWLRTLTTVLILTLLAMGVGVRRAAPLPVPTQGDVSYDSHPHQIMDVHVSRDGQGPITVWIWYGGLISRSGS